MSKPRRIKDSKKDFDNMSGLGTETEEIPVSFFKRRLTRRNAIVMAGKAMIGVTAASLIAGTGLAVYYTTLQRSTGSTSTTFATSSSSTPPTSSSTTTPSITEIQSYVVDPAVTEGPYFVDEKLNRSDIRIDPTDNSVQPGTRLVLNLSVHKTIDGAFWSPLTGAQVDIWHANYQGIYSDEAANGTIGKKFLRGYQVTDQNGAVQFTTVYPGWYSGRTIHLHIKVRAISGSTTTFAFTSQLFFDDAITGQALGQVPYSARGLPDTTNATDSVFTGASSDGAVQKNVGDQLLLAPTKDANGYTGTFNIGVRTTS
jgi:protocatechuate 3,4-dioxygenase beta subunit